MNSMTKNNCSNKNNNNKNTVNMICDLNKYLINITDQNNINNYNNNNNKKIMNEYTKFDDLLKMIENEQHLQIKPRQRLCGGGESSLNNGTSVWGSSPNAHNSSNNNNPWGNTSQQPLQAWGNTQQQPNASQRPPQDPNMNQAKPQQAQSQMQGTNNMPPGQNKQPSTAQQPQSQQPPQPSQIIAGQSQQVASTTSAKMEHLNSMREALFSQDGWGCQYVNQDSQWDIPISPEPSKTDLPSWKNSQNNGTDLWEANLRNGGQPPQTPQSAPWKPSTNIGGHWEDDNTNDGENVWTGGGNGGGAANNPPNPNPAPSAWNQPGGATSIWPSTTPAAQPKKENDWGVNMSNPPNNWDNRPNQPISNIPAPVDMPRPPGVEPPNRDIKGDPRGISGRLNGSSGMWDQPPFANMPPNKMPPLPPTGNNQWPINPPNNPVNKMPGGWGDTSPPPTVRRAISNDDAGTNLWNQRTGNNNWKDLPPVNRGTIGGTGPGPRLPPPVQMPMSIQNRSNSWDEPPTVNNNNWDDKFSATPWNDSQSNNQAWNKNKAPAVAGWPDDIITSDWPSHGNKPPNKMSPMEFIRHSKQFKLLCEMGFKKEDIELALRTTNMNIDEALDLLQRANPNPNPGGSDWRRHDDHPHGGASFEQFQGRFPSSFDQPFSNNKGADRIGSSMGFLPNNPNNAPGGNPGGSIGGNQNLSALKFLNQVPPNTMPPFGQPNVHDKLVNVGMVNNQSSQQPSTQQLRMLVQQIQMAVQAGYLNPQILNQPLAPQTLYLLNQLLNNIKQLQHAQGTFNRGGNMNNAQMGMQISKMKSQISSLQNQIAQQQAIYVKQQSQQGNTNSGGIGNDFLRSPNEMSALTGNFQDLSLNKDHGNYPTLKDFNAPSSNNQQSRLNQWKLPSLEKEGNDTTDFSRTPGTGTNKSSLSTTNASMGSLGLQNDGTWSSVKGGIGDGWPDSSNDASKQDWPNVTDTSSFTDLVPEFEPGKPWKGTQMKIEDDPTITPGSVARSPLSIAAAKETDLFATTSKTSPTETLNLSSSTWSFNNSQQGFSNTITKPSAELWHNPIGKASQSVRGPPPGLVSNKSQVGVTSNGWIGQQNTQRSNQSNNWSSGSGGNWFSTWLLLKNLTAQIDGSTLRTLCMQHGPLQNFHLYLNHGVALCKYSTREEANKAQQALNNCVLSNTTICAEIITENEVQSFLQRFGTPGGNGGTTGSTTSGNTWRPSNPPPTRSTTDWSSSWSGGNNSSSLWQPLDAERGTPSNLISFLPENLLTGELN